MITRKRPLKLTGRVDEMKSKREKERERILLEKSLINKNEKSNQFQALAQTDYERALKTHLCNLNDVKSLYLVGE